MKKNRILSFLTITALFIIFMGVAALSLEYGPERIEIDDVTRATHRYLPVTFYHGKHINEFGVACVTCHHDQDETFTSGDAPLCIDCHSAGTEIGYKDSMHRSCVICHIDEVAIGKEPPTDCFGCHPERK
jgi:hypothetical protein